MSYSRDPELGYTTDTLGLPIHHQTHAGSAHPPHHSTKGTHPKQPKHPKHPAHAQPHLRPRQLRAHHLRSHPLRPTTHQQRRRRSRGTV